jgi:hypothetical protein
MVDQSWCKYWNCLSMQGERFMRLLRYAILLHFCGANTGTTGLSMQGEIHEAAEVRYFTAFLWKAPDHVFIHSALWWHWGAYLHKVYNNSRMVAVCCDSVGPPTFNIMVEVITSC